MALSGSKTVSFCNRKGANRYYLQLDWTATQSTTNNSSNVTLRLYIGSHGHGYDIRASASKSGAVAINGVTHKFTTNGLKLASGQRLLIFQKTVTIPHNNDGSKSISVSAYYNPAVTISGVYQGTVSIPSTSYTLNTIARASTLSSGASWTAGFDTTFTISRKNDGYKHIVAVYVNNVLIKTIYNVGASASSNFSIAENSKIYQQLNQQETKGTKIVVSTYSGSTLIGTSTTYGTCRTAYASTTSFPTTWDIGQSIGGTISRKHSWFAHSVEFFASNNTLLATPLNKSGNLAWSINTKDIEWKLYNLCKTTKSTIVKLKLTTFYNGVVVGVAWGTMYASVINANPFFDNDYITYKDSNAQVVALTQDDQLIVQNKSNLQILVDSVGLASGNCGADIIRYECTVSGITKTQNHVLGQNLVFDFGISKASSPQLAVIKAIDSRGNYTTATIKVKCVPYQVPSCVIHAERRDGFGETVILDVGGSYSTVYYRDNGEEVNYITSITRSISINGATHGTDKQLTPRYGNGSYGLNATEEINVDVTDVANIKVVVEDRFGAVITQQIDVPTGSPIMFIDSNKGSIAFNTFPNKEANMKINMTVDTADNQYWFPQDEYNHGERSYGINMNNSDIIGTNNIVFSDAHGKDNTEGIFFPNVNTMHSTNINDYTRLFARDGALYLSNGADNTIFSPSVVGVANMGKPLWQGAIYMHEYQTATPSRTIRSCPSGWCLVWSDYQPSTASVGNFDFVFSYVHKSWVNYHAGAGINFIIPYGQSDTAVNYTVKQLYITDTRIVGDAHNDSASTGANDVVLRYVFAF